MCSYSYLILYITSSALSTPTSETSELLKYFKLILFKTDEFELCTCLGQYGINQAGRPRRGLNLWVWSKADAASDPNRSIWFIVKSSSGHRGRSFNPQISLQIQAFPPGQEPATVPVPVVPVVHTKKGPRFPVADGKSCFYLSMSQSYISWYFFAEAFHEKSCAIARSTMRFHSRLLS